MAEFVRRTEKHTKTSGKVPTVPASNDHTDGTWVDTDIYEAELHVNLADQEIHTRDGNKIFSFTRTKSDITVVGTSQGAYNDGDVIPSGTSIFEILSNLLITVIPATYVNPTVSLAMTGNSVIEVGELISPQFAVTFDQNDGGSITSVEFKLGATPIQTGTGLTYTHANQKEATPTVRSYTAEVSYGQGPQKTDNVGNNSGTPIPAGSLTTNTRTITVRYKTWLATSAPFPTNSAEVRSLTVEEWDNVNVITIDVQNGDTSLVFAIPPNKSLVSVEFLGTLTVNQTSVFVASEQIVQVAGADGANPVDHKVYRYEPASPFSAQTTYKITLQ